MIQRSRPMSSRWIFSQSPSGVGCGPGCQKMLSSSMTGRPSLFERFCANIDFPAPPRPWMATRFMLPPGLASLTQCGASGFHRFRAQVLVRSVGKLQAAILQTGERYHRAGGLRERWPRAEYQLAEPVTPGKHLVDEAKVSRHRQFGQHYDHVPAVPVVEIEIALQQLANVGVAAAFLVLDELLTFVD